MTEEGKVIAIIEYMMKNVERQTNQSNEAYRENFGNEAYAALVLHKAACSGVCKGVMMLCEETGLECRHINANQWTHQWCIINNMDGQRGWADGQAGIAGYGEHPAANVGEGEIPVIVVD